MKKVVIAVACATVLFGMGIDLGNLYSSGHGIRQDNKIAKEYFGKACDLGDQRGCDGYKILNEQGW